MKQVSVILIALLFLYLIAKSDLLKGNKNNADAKNVNDIHVFTEEDAKIAIKAVAKKYGAVMAQTVEKMLRLETGHFKSGQYKATGSAGMEKGKWPDLPTNVKYQKFNDNHDGRKNIDFIVWDSVTDFCFYLADYINRHKGNYARWNTTNEVAQEAYRKKVDSIIPHYA